MNPIKTDAFVLESSLWGRVDCGRGGCKLCTRCEGVTLRRLGVCHHHRWVRVVRGEATRRERNAALSFQRLICKLLKTSATQMRALFSAVRCSLFSLWKSLSC